MLKEFHVNFCLYVLLLRWKCEKLQIGDHISFQLNWVKERCLSKKIQCVNLLCIRSSHTCTPQRWAMVNIFDINWNVFIQHQIFIKILLKYNENLFDSKENTVPQGNFE